MAFHQNLLQEVTYESVLKRDRAALHKVAAGWLEGQARQAGRLDEFAGLLGEHCERAGELSAAADWYLQAGRSAFGQGAPRQAKDLFTRALALLPPVDRERRWQVLLGREEALAVLGDAEPWKADITALMELARSVEDDHYLAEAYLRQAIFGIRTGEASVADQASREALAAALRCGYEAVEVKALALTAIAEVYRDKQLAVEHIEEALRSARKLGDENVLSFVLNRAAYCFGELDDVNRWYPLYTEQIELDHRLGNRMQEATALGNIGSSFMVRGLYKQARSLIEQAIKICQALGARRPLAYDLANLGELYRDTGDLRKARQFAEQALQEIIPTGDARGKAFALASLGWILLSMEDAAGASRSFSETRELASSKGSAGMTSEATADLAACFLKQGQLDEARKCVHEAWDYLKEQGWMEMGDPPKVFLTCVEVFDALGEDENALAVLEGAHQALMEVADKTNVPEWRQSFLENNPDARAILEMWERRKQ
jgi:eukaryotic-like serine/threonine-protein kinase